MNTIDAQRLQFTQQLNDRLMPLVELIYPDGDTLALLQRLCDLAYPHAISASSRVSKWDESTVFLITYGDSLLRQNSAEMPLQTLAEFLEQYLVNCLNVVHILPFFPYSSDDGFAIIDYRQVNPQLGDWADIERIAENFGVMSDLVINHVSSQSEWFQQFIQQRAPGCAYFIACDPDDPDADYHAVVRPRSSPLLTPVETPQGVRHVWTTFSADQVDLNFRNPDVLLELIDVLLGYCRHGAKFIRLDAVGFLWKELGTSCMHLPQTHAAVRLIREILALTYTEVAIVTETNVPNRENLSYFGNRNEAHMIYNFSLPPLLLNALMRGEAQHLKTWMMSMPPAPEGCAYFNFTASHDGIGMRPAEGLLSQSELDDLCQTMQRYGGKISYRRQSDGRQTPYEINISLFDAMQGTVRGRDQWQRQRFLCSQAVMLSLEGVPAFYIHSLLATPNDADRVEETGHNRSINRHQWDYEQLQQRLAQPDSDQAWVFAQLTRLMAIRRDQLAFHPNATQYTLHLRHTAILGMWRQSRDRAQSIFCLHNLSDQAQSLLLSEINLICTDEWHDLISGEQFSEDCRVLELLPYQTVWITNFRQESPC